MFVFCTAWSQEDDEYNYQIFEDTSKSEEERLHAIYYVRLIPYKRHQSEIDDFINQLESTAPEGSKLACEIAIFKSRILFMEVRLLESIPAALNILNGDCELSFRDSILIYWSLAKSIEHGGVYLEALNYRKKIQKMLPRYLERYPSHIQYLTNMSDYYYSQEKYEEAKNSFQENLKYLNTHDKMFYVGTVTNSIGVCFNHLNQPDSAIAYFNQAIKLYVEHNNFDSAYIYGLINGNKAQSLMLKGEFKEAIPLLKLDVEGSKDIEPKNALASMMELTRCFYEIGKVTQAKHYCDTIDNSSELAKVQYSLQLEYLEVKASIFESLDAPDSANGFLREIIAIIEKRDREIAINQSSVLVAIYGVKEKQKIIDKQKIENQNAQLELIEKSRNQWLIIGVSAGILVVLIVVLVGHNKVSKQKRQLHEQNEINKASLEEKEVLLKEIHHRVKNNLQVVSGLLHLQSSKIDSPEVLAIIEEGQQRIESMALIHQMLYQDDTDVAVIECQEYLDQLVGQIEHSYGGDKKVEISINANNLKLDFDYAIPLGLIVNELTVNSFKYAFPNGIGEIGIEIKNCGEKHFVMTFTDNGVGIQDIENLESSNSLGLRLVRMFCEEMDAELLVTNTPGATFSVFFKECSKNEREG